MGRLPPSDWFVLLMQVLDPVPPDNQPNKGWWESAVQCALNGKVECQLVLANAVVQLFHIGHHAQLKKILCVPSQEEKRSKQMKLTFRHHHATKPFVHGDLLFGSFEKHTPVLWKEFVTAWFLHSEFDIKCMNAASCILHALVKSNSVEVKIFQDSAWFIDRWISPWFSGESERRSIGTDVYEWEVDERELCDYEVNTLVYKRLYTKIEGPDRVVQLVANLARDPDSSTKVIHDFFLAGICDYNASVRQLEWLLRDDCCSDTTIERHKNKMTTIVKSILEVAETTYKTFHSLLINESKQQTVPHILRSTNRPQDEISFPFLSLLLRLLSEHKNPYSSTDSLKTTLLATCKPGPLKLAIQMHPSTPSGLIRAVFIPHFFSFDVAKLILGYFCS